MFDTEIAGYILNSNVSKYPLEYLANEYMEFDIEAYLAEMGEEKKPEENQMNLFDSVGADSISDRLRRRVQLCAPTRYRVFICD